MERIGLMLALAAIAVVVALVIQRRKPAGDVATAAPRAFSAPTQLVRSDFAEPAAPWLVVLFSSTTCESCKGTWGRIEPLRTHDVAVQRVDVEEQQDLHDRYGVEAVPTIVVVDANGVVMRSFLGPPSTTDLSAAVQEAQEPGAMPESAIDRS